MGFYEKSIKTWLVVGRRGGGGGQGKKDTADSSCRQTPTGNNGFTIVIILLMSEDLVCGYILLHFVEKLDMVDFVKKTFFWVRGSR
jgi:hypothetical protein